MLKTFFASTAIATTLGFAAYAEQSTDPAAPAIEAQGTAPVPAMPSAETAAEPAVPGAMTPAPVAGAERVLTPVASADISADKLIGTSIETRAGENVASVEDVLMDPSGQVQNVVAQFGGFLGFGSNKVLLNPTEIEVLQDETGKFVVQTDLTPEALEGRPEYTAEQ